MASSAEDDEVCEIDDQGPVPVAVARGLANNTFLRLALRRAGDIRAFFRDRTWVVPDYGTSFGFEIDHVRLFAEGGPTTLDNLCLPCHHHHFLKTYEG